MFTDSPAPPRAGHFLSPVATPLSLHLQWKFIGRQSRGKTGPKVHVKGTRLVLKHLYHSPLVEDKRLVSPRPPWPHFPMKAGSSKSTELRRKEWF